MPHAEAIFVALTQLQPSKAAPYVGLALAYLNAGRGNEAVAVLDNGAVAVDPQDLPELQAVRALALQLAGRLAESRRVLRDYPETSLSKAMQGIGESPPQQQET